MSLLVIAIILFQNFQKCVLYPFRESFLDVISCFMLYWIENSNVDGSVGELARPNVEWACSGPVKVILTSFEHALSILITSMLVNLVSICCSQVVPLLHVRTTAEPTGPSVIGGNDCCGHWQSSCYWAKTIWLEPNWPLADLSVPKELFVSFCNKMTDLFEIR